MATINARTKIAAILKANPEALEAIVSISPHFKKLRNPVLRKILASRATLQMASKLGGCRVEDFFEKLRPLGFEIDEMPSSQEHKNEGPPPAFMNDLRLKQITELDVRPVMEAGQDPFKIISEKIKQLEPGQVLKLINSFEPVPLIELLAKQGIESHVEFADENCVVTYFNKTSRSVPHNEKVAISNQSTWNETLHRFEGKLQYVDVRSLEMPLPMFTILDELTKLPTGYALFVYHKRVPVFLLPELQQRGFKYLILDISEAEVHLLIFHSI
ncbi:MAG: DUF2249 domain-containing protein [Bacteroidetes bacterium]|nr:DUF2249 domain-containing protein [Bacteroidota bacterium]